MNQDQPQSNKELTQLASHLSARREEIVEVWRRAVEADAGLTTASDLSRRQFEDHIPEVLEDFGRKLTGQGRAEEGLTQQNANAARHAMNRWRHGFHQLSIMREWGHLHLCLLEELENYGCAHRDLDAAVMSTARRALAELVNEAIIESVREYADLQRLEAAGRLRDLEQALSEAKMLESSRAELLRDATHDLRGKLNVVYSVTEALGWEGASEEERNELIKMLQESLESLRNLLNDLMSLARLEAGEEQPKQEKFDAARVLKDLCGNLRVLAAEKNLFLKTEGPAKLPVEGDALMTQRIAQNLLLNALKYTQQGGVEVSWDGDEKSWTLSVQDTGPGFQGKASKPLPNVLRDAAEQAAAKEKAEASESQPLRTEIPMSPGPLHETPSEGIGLSIVKRLCDLLSASLEVENRGGKGSTFRVTFPR